VFRLPHFNRGWPILAFFARVGIHNPYSEGFTGPGGRILLTRFLTEPEVGNPSTVMQVLKQRTAHALLPKRRRRNPRQRNLFGDELPCRVFWQARFYDFNVWTTKKRVEKLRYMHRNPVKRRLVETPEQWHWRSYRFYLLEEAGPVRVNEGWGKISFPGRAA
jgi:hypothetical protein